MLNILNDCKIAGLLTVLHIMVFHGILVIWEGMTI